MSQADKDKVKDEIFAKCDLVADCWVYRVKNPDGYGLKYINGKMRTVSRFILAYYTRESLDIKFDACHVRECAYRACCNPRHLFWGSHRENAAQREQEARERRHANAVLPAVPLGHQTHAQHAEWLSGNTQGVDSSLYEVSGLLGQQAERKSFVSATV